VAEPGRALGREKNRKFGHDVSDTALAVRQWGRQGEDEEDERLSPAVEGRVMRLCDQGKLVIG